MSTPEDDLEVELLWPDNDTLPPPSHEPRSGERRPHSPARPYHPTQPPGEPPLWPARLSRAPSEPPLWPAPARFDRAPSDYPLMRALPRPTYAPPRPPRAQAPAPRPARGLGRLLLGLLMLSLAGAAGGFVALRWGHSPPDLGAQAQAALSEEPAGQALPEPKTRAAAQPVDPAVARGLVVSALLEAQVPHGAIQHGHYPLRGAAYAPDAQIDLVSFTCPSAGGCGPILAALEAQTQHDPWALLAPTAADRPGRPIVRAVLEGGRPALAVRAFPPGGRLTVVLTGLGWDERVEAQVQHADPDLSYALDAHAPRAAALAARLAEQGRELIVDVSGLPREVDLEAQVAQSLTHFPQAAGLLDATLGGRQPSAARAQAVLAVAKAQGRYVVDDQPAQTSATQGLAMGLQARWVGPGLRVAAQDDAQRRAQLAAAQAQLALNGSALVLLEATEANLSALAQWLPSLKARGVQLLRASEVAL